MNRVVAAGVGRGPSATAVVRLAPKWPGLSGSAQTPTGEPVPIAALLTHVLARYGLPESVAPAAPPRRDPIDATSALDVWA